MEEQNIQIYFPQILLGMGEAVNEATEQMQEVDWSTVSSEDNWILKNPWYVKPDHPTLEPGELHVNPDLI